MCWPLDAAHLKSCLAAPRDPCTQILVSRKGGEGREFLQSGQTESAAAALVMLSIAGEFPNV